MNTASLRYNPEVTEDISPIYNIPKNFYDTESEGSVSLTPASKVPESSVGEDNLSEKIPKITLVTPFSVPLKGKFTLLQFWEGRVIEVREFEFDAIITDKTNTDFADEFVTIEKSEITPDDLPLLNNGSVFYWSVGYLDYPGRGRSRESKIRFRRLKGWTSKEISEAKRIGKQYSDFFKSYSKCPPTIR